MRHSSFWSLVTYADENAAYGKHPLDLFEVAGSVFKSMLAT
jgi:hypothetical protein